MPRVIVCTYCYEKISSQNDEYIDVPHRSGEVAHVQCYKQANSTQPQSSGGSDALTRGR